jgi:hypothetical protein
MTADCHAPTLTAAVTDRFRADSSAVCYARVVADAPFPDWRRRHRLRGTDGPRKRGARRLILADPATVRCRLLEKTLPELPTGEVSCYDRPVGKPTSTGQSRPNARACLVPDAAPTWFFFPRSKSRCAGRARSDRLFGLRVCRSLTCLSEGRLQIALKLLSFLAFKPLEPQNSVQILPPQPKRKYYQGLQGQA